jgi:methionyl-tRNA formyltransferase
MTAVVFGKGPVAISAAKLLLAHSYELLFVVLSGTEVPGQPYFSDWARDNGIEARRPDRLDDLALERADFGISVFYDKIFRQRHIDRFGMLVNVHNGPLPRYRGVRPINWALKNRETSHGVTLHLITPGIDEGPVLDHETYPIDPDADEVRDVYARALSASVELLERSLPQVWDITPVPQDESLATYYSAADDERLGDRRFWTRADATLA